MNLQQTVESLKAQFGTEFDANKAKADKFFEQLGKFAFGGFGAVLVIGLGILLVAIYNKFIGSGQNILVGVFLILFLIFAVLSLVYVIYTAHKESVKQASPRKLDEEHSTSQPKLAVPDTGKLLNESTVTPIPSVTENTTDLLHVKARTRKL